MKSKITQPLLAALAILLPALVIAQWQVNPQVYRGGAPNTGSMRYGLSAPNTMPIQSANMMLPSQVRYATWTSGALPSEVRMNAAAVGPLSPSGSIAYIPPPPVYRSTQPPTQGNFVNTQANVGGPPPPGWAGLPPTAGGMTGSVRYTPTTPASVSQQVTPWSAFQPSSISGVPIGQALGSPMAGSVKYTP